MDRSKDLFNKAPEGGTWMLVVVTLQVEEKIIVAEYNLLLEQ